MIIEEWERRKLKARDRLAICKECPEYVTLTSQCKECGCIMLAKAMFPGSECPLGKWGKDDTASANT